MDKQSKAYKVGRSPIHVNVSREFVSRKAKSPMALTESIEFAQMEKLAKNLANKETDPFYTNKRQDR